MNATPKRSALSIFEGMDSPSVLSSSSNESSISYDDIGSDSTTESSISVLSYDEDPVESVLRREAYCFDFTRFAQKLVDATYLKALKRLTQTEKVVTVIDIVVPIIYQMIELVLHTKYSDYSVYSAISTKDKRNDSAISNQSISWPKISEFNIKLGLEKLEDYVSSWNRSPEWLFCVEFLGFESEDCSNIFVYEVEWSKPTYEYPIPQATASVYFALEVLKMVPYNYDRNIEVTYVFESSNTIHVPGKIDFQEKWLEYIIHSKIETFKTFVFAVSNYKVISLNNLLLSRGIKCVGR